MPVDHLNITGGEKVRATVEFTVDGITFSKDGEPMLFGHIGWNRIEVLAKNCEVLLARPGDGTRRP